VPRHRAVRPDFQARNQGRLGDVLDLADVIARERRPEEVMAPSRKLDLRPGPS